MGRCMRLVSVSPSRAPTHTRLRAFSVELSRVKGRHVTISESIDELLDMLNREARMVRDIANGRAGRYWPAGPPDDDGCSDPPEESCSDAGCPIHGHDWDEDEEDDDE